MEQKVKSHAEFQSRPKLQVELDWEDWNELNSHLGPGEKSCVFRAIVKDLNTLMRKIGTRAVLLGIVNGDMTIDEYTTLGKNLRAFVDGINGKK